MFQFIKRALNDAVLGFLALVSLFLLITPSVFALSAAAMRGLAIAELAIVGLFAIEYLAGVLLATDKTRFLLNRWRLLDAVIIIAAVVPFFPAGPDFLRNSPVLRLLRLGRVALLGTRSSRVLASVERPVTEPGVSTAEPAVVALDPTGVRFESVPWEMALARVATAEPDWLFVSGVTEDRLSPIATALGVPEQAMRGLFKLSVPRFGRLEEFATLFVRYPLPMHAGGRLRRTPVLLVGTADNVVVLSTESTDLEMRVEEQLRSLGNDMPRMLRASVALLGAIMRANTDVVERLELNLLAAEAQQASQNDEAFLASSFDLRSDILRVRSSLKHLRLVLRDLARGDLTLGATQAGERELFRLLEEDSRDLYEGIDDLRESLQALVDLRLNVASFQMNRVMRYRAEISIKRTKFFAPMVMALKRFHTDKIEKYVSENLLKNS